MTIEVIDSRQQGGTLTLDGKQFQKQSTSVALTPSTATSGGSDAVTVLSGAVLAAEAPSESTTWTLDLGLISDFLDETGLIEWCRANAGSVVPVVWTPNMAADGPTYGSLEPLQVRVRPVAIGGDVTVRLTPTVSFTVVGNVPAPEWGPVNPGI